MDKKRLAINMSAQLLVFIINLGISFVLTAVIDSSIDDAYGFTKTANDIVTWAQIVVSALNTMASRFITIQLHKKDHQGANEYFSSVFYAFLLVWYFFFFFFASHPFVPRWWGGLVRTLIFFNIPPQNYFSR